MAATVEEGWGELSEERRELLADFAYRAIDSPSDMGAKLHAFLNRCYGAWMILQGERDAFVAYARGASQFCHYTSCTVRNAAILGGSRLCYLSVMAALQSKIEMLPMLARAIA